MTYGSIQYAGKSEGRVRDAIALNSLLEYTTNSSFALTTVLDVASTSSLPIFSLLEADIWRKEPYRTGQTWVEEPKHE